jgi:hypothetical protein
MRHLLAHTGGWRGDYFDVVGPGDDALAEMVGRLILLEQLTPLGTVWSYNNAGFYIAGRAIEVIAGMPFEQALKELVLDPLGLERSFFFAEDVLTHRFVVGHDRSGAVARPWGIGRPAAPAGGLVASVNELLGYARLVFGETDVLRPESLAALREPQADVGSSVGRRCRARLWYLFERDGPPLRHARGTYERAAGALRRVPGGALRLRGADEPQRRLVALATELRHSSPRPARDRAALRRADRALARRSSPDTRGTYEATLSRTELALQEGGLVLTMTPEGRASPTPDSPPQPGPPPTRIEFESADLIVATDEPFKGMHADFIRDDSGRDPVAAARRPAPSPRMSRTAPAPQANLEQLRAGAHQSHREES